MADLVLTALLTFSLLSSASPCESEAVSLPKPDVITFRFLRQFALAPRGHLDSIKFPPRRGNQERFEGAEELANRGRQAKRRGAMWDSPGRRSLAPALSEAARRAPFPARQEEGGCSLVAAEGTGRAGGAQFCLETVPPNVAATGHRVQMRDALITPA